MSHAIIGRAALADTGAVAPAIRVAAQVVVAVEKGDRGVLEAPLSGVTHHPVAAFSRAASTVRRSPDQASCRPSTAVEEPITFLHSAFDVLWRTESDPAITVALVCEQLMAKRWA